MTWARGVASGYPDEWSRRGYYWESMFRASESFSHGEDDPVLDAVDASRFLDALLFSLSLLSRREVLVISLRLGLVDDQPMTLRGAGLRLRLSAERVRQIHLRALRKLRHPTRSSRLRAVRARAWILAVSADPQLPLMDLPSVRMLFKYAEHRRRHPEVYHALRDLAKEAKRRGRTRIGIAALFEILRWERGGIGKDDEGWKLNQDLRALYARALEADDHELRGMFEKRRLRAV